MISFLTNVTHLSKEAHTHDKGRICRAAEAGLRGRGGGGTGADGDRLPLRRRGPRPDHGEDCRGHLRRGGSGGGRHPVHAGRRGHGGDGPQWRQCRAPVEHLAGRDAGGRPGGRGNRYPGNPSPLRQSPGGAGRHVRRQGGGQNHDGCPDSRQRGHCRLCGMRRSGALPRCRPGFASKFGRAKSYGDKTLGTPDAGAMSMAYFFQGLAQP